MNNKNFSIGELIKNVRLEKLKEEYVLLPNLKANFRSLRSLDDLDIYEAKEVTGTASANELVDTIYGYSSNLVYQNIPFDGISVTGLPGMILKRDAHINKLRSFINEQHEKANNNIRWAREWGLENTRDYIKNLKIEETLFDYVPLNLVLSPYLITDDNQKIPSCFFLCRDEINAEYSRIVKFGEFYRALSDNGYNLKLVGVDVKDYIEYFNMYLEIGKDCRLNMDIDFTNKDNIRK